MMWKRHVDQLRARVVDHLSGDEVAAPEVSNVLLPSPPAAESVTEPETSAVAVPPQPEVLPDEVTEPVAETAQPTEVEDSPSRGTPVKTTRCGKAVRQPARYRDTN